MDVMKVNQKPILIFLCVGQSSHGLSAVIINIPSGSATGPSAGLPGSVRRHSSSDDADSDEILNDDNQSRGAVLVDF